MELWREGSVQVELLVIIVACYKVARRIVRIPVEVNELDIFVPDL